ncbi:MAG: MATE family efflux transporter [Blautia marasmi]
MNKNIDILNVFLYTDTIRKRFKGGDNIDRKPFGKTASEESAAHHVYPDHIFTDIIQYVRPDRRLLCIPGCRGIRQRSRWGLLPCHCPDRGITTTVGTGTGSVLSRKLGAKEQEKAADAVGCMFFLWIVCAGLITFVGLSLFEPLIRLLGAAGQILPYIRDYGKILLAGTLISTGFSGVMRANGDISYSTLQWSLPSC